MADIKDMSREEIEQYLASMPKDTTEPSAEQKTTAAEIMRGADGNYDLSKVNLSKMFADKANEHGYTDDETSEKKSFNKGSKWQAYIDKNVTDPAAKADMENQIYAIVSANPSMSPKELKYRLRAVEANLRRRYPNGVSKNFDISGSMLDSTMAKDLLALGLKGKAQPAQSAAAQKSVEQKPVEQKPAAETPKETQSATEQKPAEQKGPTTNDELNAAFKRIKNKQASDADLALFSKYSEEQLKKMGFGPISITAIKGKKQDNTSTRTGQAGGNGLGQNPVKPGEMEAANQKIASAKANALKLSDEDQAFMDKYKGYTKQLSGAQPRSIDALKAMQSSEAYKFINDPANKERYSQLLKTEADNKKTNKANISAAKAERNKVGMAKAMDQYYAHH